MDKVGKTIVILNDTVPVDGRHYDACKVKHSFSHILGNAVRYHHIDSGILGISLYDFYDIRKKGGSHYN